MDTEQSRASHEDINIFWKVFFYEENKSSLTVLLKAIFTRSSQSYYHKDAFHNLH